MLALVFCVLSSISSTTYAFSTSQKPLNGAEISQSILEVRAELRKAEIIPTVIDDFLPSLLLNVTWPTKKHKKTKTADLGNTLKPSKLQDPPELSITDDVTSSLLTNSVGIHYTLAMTDPDAPARDDPEWSEFCHWIITDIHLPPRASPSSPSRSLNRADRLREIMPYKPPGPPKKTGKHRYVFLVLAPANSTTEPLYPSKPKDRKHWGYDGPDGERRGVREWMAENRLVVVGANFIYAQNKKQ